MMEVPADDRGLHYGDGLFETMLVLDGRVAFASRHIQRLHRDAERLAIPSPGISQLNELVNDLAASVGNGIVKVILTRGSGGRGYRPPENPSPRVLFTTHPNPDWPEAFKTSGVAVRWCDLQLSRQPRLAGVKHLNRLEQVLARNEWRDMDAWQEGLMCDTTGSVVEGTQSNLFAVIEGNLCTPMLDQCGVAGIMRDMILEAAGKLGIPTRELRLSKADVLGATEILLCNSIVGIWPVQRVADHNFVAPGPITKRLQDWLTQCDYS